MIGLKNIGNFTVSGLISATVLSILSLYISEIFLSPKISVCVLKGSQPTRCSNSRMEMDYTKTQVYISRRFRSNILPAKNPGAPHD